MSRIINGLKWARRLEGRPRVIPQSKNVRGAKLKGLQYERALAKALKGRLEHGIWWEFEDSEGRGFCQTDFIGEDSGLWIILECKYTWTEEAEDQLNNLYLPVVGKALELKYSQLIPVVVCKNLLKGITRPTFASLQEALVSSYNFSSLLSGISIWHHLGPVPLLRKVGASPVDFRPKILHPSQQSI